MIRISNVLNGREMFYRDMKREENRLLFVPVFDNYFYAYKTHVALYNTINYTIVIRKFDFEPHKEFLHIQLFLLQR